MVFAIKFEHRLMFSKIHVILFKYSYPSLLHVASFSGRNLNLCLARGSDSSVLVDRSVGVAKDSFSGELDRAHWAGYQSASANGSVACRR